MAVTTAASNWYLTFNALDEDGWRDESPSEIRQLFGKIGWEDDQTDLDLSYIFADNALTGNGFAPESLLARDRAAGHTFPDDTDNGLHFLNLRASHAFTDALLLAGNAYYRGYQRDTLNGDAEVQCVDEDDNAVDLALSLCEGSAAPGGVGELELEVEGEDRTTETGTDGYGGTLQLSHQGALFGRTNSQDRESPRPGRSAGTLVPAKNVVPACDGHPVRHQRVLERRERPLAVPELLQRGAQVVPAVGESRIDPKASLKHWTASLSLPPIAYTRPRSDQ